MKFTYIKSPPQLFKEDQEIIPVKHDEKNNPYFVFSDSSAHWIKLHLTPRGNLKKVFYKSPTGYYLRHFSPPRRRKIVSFQLTELHQVEKQLTGWEPANPSRTTRR